MVDVQLINVTKRFGKVVAADHVSLHIRDGELFTLLGPSGCGKTTILRLIAGLETPDEGRILIGGEDVTYLPPYKRGTAMVFQNYALWPHMTVFENVAYGLKIRKLPKDEIKRRVKWALEMVKLSGLENRLPNQLSGGQQQRVALARAIVVNPKVLLLDEPLSNLDAKLRVEVRGELKKLQRKLKITTIYVTHDQEEAMFLSDRMAVLNKGRVQQVGTPMEIYRYPRNLFVADFIGRCNCFEGTVKGAEGGRIFVDCGGVELVGTTHLDVDPKPGQRVFCIIRPEDLTPAKPPGVYNSFEVKVSSVSFYGERVEVAGEVGGKTLIAVFHSDVDLNEGDNLTLYVSAERTLILFE